MIHFKEFFKRIATGEYLLDGQKIPKWFGYSYYKPATDLTVFYLIPFNLIVRYLRKIFLFLIFPRTPFHCDHYNRGFRDGVEKVKGELIWHTPRVDAAIKWAGKNESKETTIEEITSLEKLLEKEIEKDKIRKEDKVQQSLF